MTNPLLLSNRDYHKPGFAYGTYSCHGPIRGATGPLIGTARQFDVVTRLDDPLQSKGSSGEHNTDTVGNDTALNQAESGDQQ